uniref:Uncharacterized protein n=1 Tax=Anguilla anguilla TaxID=7936 RepID=A0A0E9VN27_ANGAN
MWKLFVIYCRKIHGCALPTCIVKTLQYCPFQFFYR